jgi:hypothetical protein
MKFIVRMRQRLLVALLALLLPAAYLSAQPTTNGLKLYWPLDETAGTVVTDATGNGFNATLINGPAWSADGRVGGAVRMADRQGRYLHCPSLTWQPVRFTASWWTYTESYGSWCNVVYAGGSPWGFSFRGGNSGEVFVGTSATTQFTGSQLPAGTIELNKWQHFTYTFDNGAAKFYKNGQLLASKTGMAMPVAWIGFNFGGGDQAGSLHGSADEVRIYDRALTDAEVGVLAAWYTPRTYTWRDNAATTDWNTAGNWVEGAVPTRSGNVVR